MAEAFGKKHPFGSNLEEMGIKHRLIPPGAKELNGKVERSHRIDDDEFYWKAPLHSFGLLQQYLAQWIYEYNHDRPHSSLNIKTPVEMLTEKLWLQIAILGFSLGINCFHWIDWNKKNTSLLDNYFNFLDWIQSDPFHVQDVQDFYISNWGL